MNRKIAKIAVKTITENYEVSDTYLLGCYALLRELSDEHFYALELLAKGPIQSNEVSYAVLCDLSYLEVVVSVCVDNDPNYTALISSMIDVANIKNSCYILSRLDYISAYGGHQIPPNSEDSAMTSVKKGKPKPKPC